MVKAAAATFLPRALLTATLFLAVAPPATVWWEAANRTGLAVIIGDRTYAYELIPEVRDAHLDAEAFKRYVLDTLGFDAGNVDLRDARRRPGVGVRGRAEPALAAVELPIESRERRQTRARGSEGVWCAVAHGATL